MRGRSISHVLRGAACLAALFCLTLSPALSAAGGHADLAGVSVSDAAVHWSPSSAYETLALRVTGPEGFAMTERFAGGSPSLSIFDKAGQALPDGSYTWELWVERTMSPGEREAAMATRGQQQPARQVQSGHFRVAGGAFVNPEAGEEMPLRERRAPQGDDGPTLATRDQVIADDLIVDGSACIGFDCVNGEVFGFDTLRLKENNLRILFQDTSNSASFPTNDWQLTANDSNNGGQERFSIEDVTNSKTPFTVEGNSPNNALYVDSSGNVGFGTSTPVVELHVKDGDTPTLRLEQDGSSGFAARTWDVAGNEANFFIRDSTANNLVFRILDGAPGNAIIVDGDGEVGFGTGDNPASKLHVENGDLRVRRTATTRAQAIVENSNTTAAAAAYQMINAANSWEFQADTFGNVLFRDITQNSNPFVIEPAVANEVLRIDSGSGGRIGIRTGNNVNFTLEVNGTIGVTGTGQVHPDYVFEPDYELPPIAEHAVYLFENKHLPAVGPGQYDDEGRAVIDLGARSHGMLEELEKAHLYIVQLHERVEQLEKLLAELRSEKE